MGENTELEMIYQKLQENPDFRKILIRYIVAGKNEQADQMIREMGFHTSASDLWAYIAKF